MFTASGFRNVGREAFLDEGWQHIASNTELILFTKRRPPVPQPLQFQNVTIPWSNTVKYLGLLLDSKLLFMKHLQTVLHTATGTFLKIFPLLT